MLEIILYVVFGCSLLFSIGAIYGLVTLEDKTKYENHRLFVLIVGLILIVIALAFDSLKMVGVVAIIGISLIWLSTHNQEDEEEEAKRDEARDLHKRKLDIIEEWKKENPEPELSEEQKKKNKLWFKEFKKKQEKEIRRLYREKEHQEGRFWIWEKGYWKKK